MYNLWKKYKNNAILLNNYFNSILDLVISCNKLLSVENLYEHVVPADLYHPVSNISLSINLSTPYCNCRHKFNNFLKVNF